MRRCLVALCLFGLASPAVAGDFDVPTLRGSSPYIPAAATYPDWSGFYVGGQVGYGNAMFDFKGATETLISYLLRTTFLENEQHPSQWGVLGKAYTANATYGGFVGYNTQWQDAVIGIDIHYSRSDLFDSAPVSPIRRVVSAGGNTYDVTVDGSASMRILDYGSARLRAGWVVGNFLPYATLGGAIGRADVSRSARVVGAENPPAGYPAVACDPLANCNEFDFRSTQTRKAAWIYGWSAGLGFDTMLTSNLFLRAEYEFIQFGTIESMNARINSARVGAGLRF